jgi:hypothetical protein
MGKKNLNMFNKKINNFSARILLKILNKIKKNKNVNK